MIDFVHANRSKLGVVMRKLLPSGKTVTDSSPAVFLYADGSLQNRGSKTQGGHLIGAGFLSEDGGAPDTCNPQGWQSAAIKRVCTSTFDGETLSLLRATEDGTHVSYLQQELIFGTFLSIAERVLHHKRGEPERLIPILAYSDGNATVQSVLSSKLTQRNKRRLADVACLRESYGHEVAVDTLKHPEASRNPSDPLTEKTKLLLTVGTMFLLHLFMTQGKLQLP